MVIRDMVVEQAALEGGKKERKEERKKEREVLRKSTDVQGASE